MDWRDIPIFIINRNRLGAMRSLIDWLAAAGMRKIVIMDNQSNYPPLLEYYRALPAGVRLMALDENHGPYVLWKQGVHKVLDTPYIVTDSDLVPADFCPDDLVPALLAALERFPDAGKVGPGLRIDNLPDAYREVDVVRKWESQFWEQPLGGGCHAAPIDTTFALYPARAEFTREAANIRLGYPYLLEHTPWYVDDRALSEEEAFYRAHTSAVFSHWSVEKKDSRVAQSPRVVGFAERPRVLHLGGGHEHIHGWINADGEGRLLDLRFDPAGSREQGIDLPDDSIDGIYMESNFTWVDDPHALLAELYRVAKPGARLVLRLPHAGSNESRADPRARRSYVPDSFASFAQTGGSHPRSDYRADWQPHAIELAVAPALAELGSEAALAQIRSDGDRVLGMLVTLEAVKPARAPGRASSARPAVRVTGQPRLVPRFASAASVTAPATAAAAAPPPLPSPASAPEAIVPDVRDSTASPPLAPGAAILHIDGRGAYVDRRIDAGSGDGRCDIAFDPCLSRARPLPLADDSLDGLHLEHVLESVRDARALFGELHRVARPGAKLHVRVGHGARADAWSDPRQVCAWYEGSFAHFAQPALAAGSGDYRGDWRLESVQVLGDDTSATGAPAPEPRELVVTLVAVKPARPRGGLRATSRPLSRAIADTRVAAGLATA